MIFKTQYGDLEIVFDTTTEKYQVLDGEAVIKESKNFQAIEKYLKTGGEKKDKPKRLDIKAWHSDYRGYKEVLITSIAEKDNTYSSSQVVWIVDNGIRSKVGMSSLYLYSDHNRNCIDDINNMRKEIEVINKKILTVQFIMTKITLKDLTEGGLHENNKETD